MVPDSVLSGVQLTLPVTPLEPVTLAQFRGAKNEKVKAQLGSFLQWGKEPFLYLSGGIGTGKSHLLQASCQLKIQQGFSALYLSCQDCQDQEGKDIFTPAMLEGLEQYDLVCIDDVSTLLVSKEMEIAFFHLFNILQDQEKQLIISDAVVPSKLLLSLPDLKSRIQSGLLVVLAPLTDDEKAKLLYQRALDRGFSLESDVVKFLMTRSDRSTAGLIRTLDMLDKASLQHKRRLTVPFIKAILGW